MEKRLFVLVIFLILFSIFLISISAQSVESGIKELTHYAEEYETGNIDYTKLIVYSSSVRKQMEEIAGVVDKNEGGIFDEAQVRKILGEPSEETKWVWDEQLQRERKLDKKIPRWENIIFDGHIIQIKINAHPSFYVKHERDEKTGEEKIIESGDKIVYRLH